MDIMDTMNLSNEEMNRIRYQVKVRLRRARRSGNKWYQFGCCGMSSKATTVAQPQSNKTNLPPPGMSPDFWCFLGLKHREPAIDFSCNNYEAQNVTESLPLKSLKLDLKEDKLQPQIASLNFTQIKEEPKEVLLEEKNRTSALEEYVSDKLKKEISDALHKWMAVTTSTLLPDTIAKIAHDVALETVQELELTKPKRCQTVDFMDIDTAKTNNNTTKVTPIKNNHVERCSSMSPATPSYSNKEDFLSCEEESDAETVKGDRKKQMVPIGDGNARVPAYLLKTINWSLYKIATRKLLQAVFGRSVLATHNLTGKASPAFPGRLPKAKLDEALVNDIVQTVAEKCGVTENIVRNCITIKCADESKWLRREQAKQKRKKKVEQIQL